MWYHIIHRSKQTKFTVRQLTIWQARRAAKRAKSRAVIGYLGGHDGVILLTQDCPFCSRNNILPKSKQLYESFLSQNIFRNSKKIFCHFSLGMEIEKNDMHHHFYVQLAFFFQCSKTNKYEDHFLQCSLCHAIKPLVSSVKMAGYWPCSRFPFLWSSTSSRSIKTQKEKLANI